MAEVNSNEVRLYLNDKLYTTIKSLSQVLGITMAMVVRSFLIVGLINKQYLFTEGDLRNGIQTR